MSNDINLNYSVNDFYKQETTIGPTERPLVENLYGINHLQTATMVPSNRDRYGYTFFTRPQLNMQSDNIRNNRKFYPLLTEKSMSIGRFVRCTLDPRMGTSYFYADQQTPVVKTPLVDNQQAFIPILTNNLLSISGWPDFSAPTFTSKPGLYNEAWGIIDGILDNYESYDLSATFRNTRGDPITYLIYIWMLYASLVFSGMLVPYSDMIANNEIDYNTRIYRIGLDTMKKYVTRISCCGAGFPISSPVGSFLDFNSEKPYNDQAREINIRFRCFGLCMYDEILVREFNDVVCIFNENMRDDRRDNYMVKVPDHLKRLFNNRGYFRIDPDTHEFEIWVDRALMNSVLSNKIFANTVDAGTNAQLNGNGPIKYGSLNKAGDNVNQVNVSTTSSSASSEWEDEEFEDEEPEETKD